MHRTEDIAHVAHDANRAYQLVTGDPAPSPPWEDAPAWQRDSATRGVQAALRGQTADELHDSWCADKTAEGWEYGPVKSYEAKTHPCLVPYHQLPEDQRTKDHLFHAIVQALR